MAEIPNEVVGNPLGPESD